MTRICFVTCFIGNAETAAISKDFHKRDDCDYILFTNLTQERLPKMPWEIITVDLEDLKHVNHAVKASRYFKFMLHEYLRKIERDYEFIFYCDAYLTPKKDENWNALCDQLADHDTGIMQYNHTGFGENMNILREMELIAKCKKDSWENIKATRKYLCEIDPSVIMKTPQYYENTVFCIHLKNETAIRQCNEFWKYYLDCPTYRDQPLWNFLYLKNKITPLLVNEVRSIFAEEKNAFNVKSRHNRKWYRADLRALIEEQQRKKQ